MDSASRRPRLVAAGYAVLDTIIHNGEFSHQAGGTAGNVAAILGALGWESYLAGVIGNDRPGRRLVADLERAGVRSDYMVQEANVATPQVVHEVRNGSHSFLFHCPQCGRRLPRSVPLSTVHGRTLLQGLDAPETFFFDRANSGAVTLAEEFRAQGALVVFEPSSGRQSAAMRRATDLADIIKVSHERRGAVSMLSIPTADQVQIITQGEQGALVRIGGNLSMRSAALEACVVDPGGAGDWTTAGLLYKLGGRRDVDQDELMEALRFGQALGALSCEWPGARGLLGRQAPREIVADAARLVASRPRTGAFSNGRSGGSDSDYGCEACLVAA